MIDWLDQHNGAVTAIATAALVVVTTIYVILTRNLARAEGAATAV